MLIRTIDVHSGFVIPPSAEGHNHWLGPAMTSCARRHIRCVLTLSSPNRYILAATGVDNLRDIVHKVFLDFAHRPSYVSRPKASGVPGGYLKKVARMQRAANQDALILRLLSDGSHFWWCDHLGKCV